MTLQWNHLVIRMWFLFHYKIDINFGFYWVTKKRRIEVIESSQWVRWLFSSNRNLRKLLWYHHEGSLWKDIILHAICLLFTKKYHGDFTLKSLNDSHKRVTRWFNITSSSHVFVTRQKAAVIFILQWSDQMTLELLKRMKNITFKSLEWLWHLW